MKQHGICTNNASICQRAKTRELIPMPTPTTRCSCGAELLAQPPPSSSKRWLPAVAIGVAVLLVIMLVVHVVSGPRRQPGLPPLAAHSSESSTGLLVTPVTEGDAQDIMRQTHDEQSSSAASDQAAADSSSSSFSSVMAASASMPHCDNVAWAAADCSQISACWSPAAVSRCDLGEQACARIRSCTGPGVDHASPGVSYFTGISVYPGGARAIIYSFVTEGDHLGSRELFNENMPTRLFSTAQGENFTAEGIHDATQAVVELLRHAREAAARQQIEPRYYLVAPSALGKYANVADLRQSLDAETHLQLELLDAEAESEDKLRAAVPKGLWDDSIIVSISQLNTEVGCMQGNRFLAGPVIPYGSKNLGAGVPADKDFETGLNALLPAIKAQYHGVSRGTACLANRVRIYFAGGVAGAIAAYSKPMESLQNEVVLSRDDVDQLLAQVRSPRWAPPEPGFSFGPNVSHARQEEIKAKNAAERSRMRDSFTREDLMAGLSLMRIILDDSNPVATIIYVRDSNYMLGYSLRKFTQIHSAADPGDPNN